MHNDCACITQLLRKGYIIVKMEWISVNKKLPQCEGWFLVSLGNEWDKNGLGKINKDKKIYDSNVRISHYDGKSFYHGMVAAWMPIPKPYEGK